MARRRSSLLADKLGSFEILFLLDPNKALADWEGVTGLANGIILNQGGEILFTNHWEVNNGKLAYPIENFKKGTYLLTFFRAVPRQVPEMEAEFRLNEVILRYLIIRHHPRIFQEILSQHTGEPIPEETEEEQVPVHDEE